MSCLQRFLGFDNGKRVTSRKHVLKTQILFHANCKSVSLENMIFYNDYYLSSELVNSKRKQNFLFSAVSVSTLTRE